MARGAFDMTDDGDDARLPGGETRGRAHPECARPVSRYRAEMLRSNLLLAGLFVLAAGGIYVLAHRRAPAQASAEQQLNESQVDNAILRLCGDQSSKTTAPTAGKITRELLQSFCDQVRQRQIPLKDLRKDPFVFVPPAPETLPVLAASGAPATQAVGPAAKPSPEDVQVALKRLNLQSVMMGRSGGIAMISSNLLTEGQTIEGFLVRRIEADSVVLERDGQEFVLRLKMQ